MRFTIKDLLVSTALIAAGVGGFCALLRYSRSEIGPSTGIWILWSACGAFEGAVFGLGLFYPFGRVWQGALWGFLSANVLLIAALAILSFR